MRRRRLFIVGERRRTGNFRNCAPRSVFGAFHGLTVGRSFRGRATKARLPLRRVARPCQRHPQSSLPRPRSLPSGRKMLFHRPPPPTTTTREMSSVQVNKYRTGSGGIFCRSATGNGDEAQSEDRSELRVIVDGRTRRLSVTKSFQIVPHRCLAWNRDEFSNGNSVGRSQRRGGEGR